jgi:hypothetical protein
MKKENPHIEALLERFFEGDTSNAEERELYAFFSGDDLPEHWLGYKELFGWFDGGIRDEAPPAERLPRPKRRPGLWAAAAAAAAAVVTALLIRPAGVPEEPPFHVESYIIRNGVKITDPAIVGPAIEAMQAQWDECLRMEYELCQNLDKMELI